MMLGIEGFVYFLLTFLLEFALTLEGFNRAFSAENAVPYEPTG